MALAPFESWDSLWRANTSTDLDLPKLIELINRRFRDKTVPTTMTTSNSRPIWNDISSSTSLEDLIRLMNRRLSSVRIPMTPDALILPPGPAEVSPYGSESITMAGKLDQSYDIGIITNFQTGTHGNAWIPLIKRYVRRIQSTSGGGGGYYRANEQLDPRSVVDPRYGLQNYRLRARECLAFSFTNGDAPGAGAHSAWAYWGFSGMPNASSTADVNYHPFVGFRMRYDRTSGGGLTNAAVWRCNVVNDQCVTLYDFQTAIAVDLPHEFQIVCDGPTSTVIFYIDGIQVGLYAFASGVAPGQVTPYVGGGAPTAAGAWNMLWKEGGTGSATFVCEFCYHMSPATPLVTLEYADA